MLKSSKNISSVFHENVWFWSYKLNRFSSAKASKTKATQVPDFFRKEVEFDTTFYYKNVPHIKKIRKEQRKFYEVIRLIRPPSGSLLTSFFSYLKRHHKSVHFAIFSLFSWKTFFDISLSLWYTSLSISTTNNYPLIMAQLNHFIQVAHF